MSTLVEQRRHRTISMALVRDLNTGRWFVEQIELRRDMVRSLLSFSNRMELSDAFEPSFLAKLSEFLPIKPEPHVLSVSGTAIELSTVVMCGLRVLTQKAMDGIQRVIVRINRVIGQVYDFLRVEFRPDAVPLGDGLADAMAALPADKDVVSLSADFASAAAPPKLFSHPKVS